MKNYWRKLKKLNWPKKKTSLQYRRVNRFDILEIGGVQRIIAKSKTDEILYYLPAEEIFDVIEGAHIAIGHGGRDRLRVETGRKYANITTKMINLFLSMCEVCNSKRSKRKRGLVSKPILHNELNSRCQVDLIDMQSQADRQFKFIMVYQDHLTKFVLLRALTSKRAEEIAYKLNEIFLTFGAPCILHSDNGREFANSVIKEFKSLWSELKIVHGKPRHSQSQGSVERANQDIENIIAAWMSDNNSVQWAEGLPYVQFMKNRAFHSGIKQSPYKAMFGIEPRVGLTTSSLPIDVISSLEKEEDLEEVIAAAGSNVVETYNEDSDSENDNQGRAAELSCTPKQCSKCSAILEANVDRDCCLNCTTEDNIRSARSVASQSLIDQAKKMKSLTDKTHPPANVGDNVTIPIPDVDKPKGALRNIIAVVLLKTDDNMYQLGTKNGVIQHLYTRSEFDLCKQKFLDVNAVKKDKQISLRQAASSASGSIQGFFMCKCAKKCLTNLCKCKKNNVLCNSKCHNSGVCNNK